MGGLIQLWLAIRPIKRIREARAAKRAVSTAAGPALSSESAVGRTPATVETRPDSTPAAPAAEDSGMSELAKSMARSVLKVLGAALVTWAVSKGFVGVDQSSALTAALESVVGGLAVIGGVLWSHRTHA